jgi:hypothetical protein
MDNKNSTKIKVTIHLPDKVTENTKRLKINKIYDILKPHKNNR